MSLFSSESLLCLDRSPHLRVCHSLGSAVWWLGHQIEVQLSSLHVVCTPLGKAPIYPLDSWLLSVKRMAWLSREQQSPRSESSHSLQQWLLTITLPLPHHLEQMQLGQPCTYLTGQPNIAWGAEAFFHLEGSGSPRGPCMGHF